jgi:hypothetical protein
MSTLATNKLGTLSGTADMSLPSARPTATKSAFLDSSGKLTFEDSAVKCEFLVVDGTAKVVKILVDVYTQNMDNVKTNLLHGSSTGEEVYGANLGYWNLPAAVQTAYFKDGNVRWWNLQGNGSAPQDSGGNWQYGRFNFQWLDSTQSIILGDQDSTQETAYGQWKTYSNTSSSKTGSGNQQYWYNTNDGSNSGNYGFGQSWLSNDGGASNSPAPWFLDIKAIPWMNGYWKVGGRYASFGNSTSYGPTTNFGYAQPGMQQAVRVPANSNYGNYGYMGAYPAGMSINVGGSGSSDTQNYGFCNFTLTAAIKPTDVVAI